MKDFSLTKPRPDFTNTEPAENVGPFPQWADKKKIVSMDPLGHLAPWLFKDTMEKENSKSRVNIRIPIYLLTNGQLILGLRLVSVADSSSTSVVTTNIAKPSPEHT